jgi:thiol-disulfide isomerase/thioredoxin
MPMTKLFFTLSLALLGLLNTVWAQDTTWQTLPLTDAATGESFTFADLEGQTVYVEPMATWCTNCRQQLGNVTEAKAELEGEVSFIALSVETTLKPEDLAAYAEKQGFDLTFAVMTPDFLRALAAEFGQSVLTPPATPHFIIRPDGSTSELMTGLSAPDAIIAAVQ